MYTIVANLRSFLFLYLICNFNFLSSVQVNDDSNESENSDNLDANIDYPSSDENNSNDSKVQNTVAPKEPISRLTYFTYTVYFCFWTTCWLIAIELKFGIVFLLFSALFGIYFNTRTGPKPRNEISAYSVFNENCESIDGTLTAEQFEREIRYGPMTVK